MLLLRLKLYVAFVLSSLPELSVQFTNPYPVSGLAVTLTLVPSLYVPPEVETDPLEPELTVN